MCTSMFHMKYTHGIKWVLNKLIDTCFTHVQFDLSVMRIE